MSERQNYIIRDQNGVEVGHGVRKTDFVEAWRDDDDNIWLPPTAWAYMAACRAQKHYHDGLKAIADGDVPRPRAKQWRDDGKPSKADKCPHDLWMYEDCGLCIEEFAQSFLASCDTQPKAGVVQQAPLVSGAVGEAETHKPSPDHPSEIPVE